MKFFRGRAMSLREAASVVFALVAILPLLVLVYLLSHASLLRHAEAQLGIFLAVTVSVLGFLVFRRLVSQITALAQGLTMPHQAVARPAAPSSTPVSGLGPVAEISQVTSAFYQMLEDLRGATQRLEDLVFKLGTLNETVELAARIPRIQDLLGQVLQTTMRAVRATGGSIMILDKEREMLTPAASRGTPDAAVSPGPVKVGEGIAGGVAQLGEPLLVDEMETDPRFRSSGLHADGGGAFICLPIRAGDRVIGVINMTKRGTGDARPQPFSTIDLQFLNALMTYIGYAVDNARLLEEAQQSARQLQTVVDDLKTTQEQLVRGETLRAVGQLSSGMAHHLNNLFAVILGRAELLLPGVDSAGGRRSLEIIQRAARDGADVARRVQRFSRLHPVSEPVGVDLNELALQVVEILRPRWQDEARLEVSVETGQIAPVIGEPAPLREVLVNLLVNGMEAMPPGGRATIRTWAGSDHVHCAVTDTGIGMTDDVRRRALEPFFTTKGPKRTGLGLSVAYGAVHGYGGSLKIDSAPGQGTTVTISLPVVASSGGEASPAAPRRAAPLRILVIDDEADARAALAEILEDEGHVVVLAPDGEKAVARLRTGESFDVVLTDLEMPGMTGWDVGYTIQQFWPRLPVGLVTGWGEQAMTGEERSRVDFVISKPFDRGKLRETLAAVPRRA
jgi:signal transduction histidine kinase